MKKQATTKKSNIGKTGGHSLCIYHCWFEKSNEIMQTFYIHNASTLIETKILIRT